MERLHRLFSQLGLPEKLELLDGIRDLLNAAKVDFMRYSDALPKGHPGHIGLLEPSAKLQHLTQAIGIAASDLRGRPDLPVESLWEQLEAYEQGVFERDE